MSQNITDLHKTIFVFAGTVDNGSPTLINNPVDTNGWGHATWFLGVHAIDIALDMKIQDDTDPAFGSGSDISGKALTQLTASSDETVYAIEIPNLVANQDRYQSTVIVVGDGAVGATFAVWCVLSDFIATADASANIGYTEIK